VPLSSKLPKSGIKAPKIGWKKSMGIKETKGFMLISKIIETVEEKNSKSSYQLKV
jgi:hypothetical protein